jgi:hypothetical protein
MFSWFIRPDKHGKMVYFFLWTILWCLREIRKKTFLDSHDNFVPNFFGPKFGPAKIQEGLDTHLKKLDPTFSK